MSVTFRSSRFPMPEGRDALVASLEALKREVVCGYAAKVGQLCDCKYGLHERPHGEARSRRSDERTGCPELAEAILVLRNLTDVEWRRAARRTFFAPRRRMDRQ